MTPQAEKRLRAWLIEQLEVKGLVATSEAPVWDNDAPETEIAARLSALEETVPAGTLVFEPERRYELARAPEELRLLRRHEGMPPGALACVQPENRAQLADLADYAASSGFIVHIAAEITADLNVLPVDPAALTAVEIVAREDGLVEFEAGATWPDLEQAARAARLAVPNVARDQFATPAAAVAGGLLRAVPAEGRAPDGLVYRVQLPPAGTTWLDRTWLFRNEDIARDLFHQACREQRGCIAQFYSKTELQVLDRSGALRLPRRYLQEPDFCAIRMIFQGPLMQALGAEFAASFPLERRWGVQWRPRQFPSAATLCRHALACGVIPVRVAVPTNWHQLADQSARIHAAMATAATDGLPAIPHRPVLFDRLTWTPDRLMLQITALAPRDFFTAEDQWWQIYRTGAAATKTAPPAPAQAQAQAALAQPDEESPEWQAIRQALIDENGQLRQLAGDETATTSRSAQHYG